ncbi:MAG: D-aminoacyl-tRNA deacylase [Pyrinomonadaceae bacterium]|nr:D-aminoacyl-tRNA deacylase [Pyrinomonadaceae bacterium]MCX7639539.1 D-aminoacyl-tRNA deacylase [Pyrinomonadaceae bacterium]MDW8304410.1 D-aminoacyl-tRNA deacylase [Acidobacteriota bacterium]
MRAVIQRVSKACVSVNGNVVGKIGKGLLVLLGVSENDTEKDALYLLDKIVNLRVFEDDAGRMNLSLLDIQGQMLVVSQFTLYGDVRRGRRPSFTEAASAEKARNLYEFFVVEASKILQGVETGVFQAMMDVELVNQGPVTILIDSEKRF